MARYAMEGIGRDRVDAVFSRWVEECLRADRSLLFDDRHVWTPEHLDEFRERFLENPLLGTEQNFLEKIETQLRGASDEVRLVAAEAVAVYLLCAWKIIGPPEKARMTKAVAAPINLEQAPRWHSLVEAFSQGIANPGPGYNIHRDLQVGYLLDFALRWKRLEQARQEELMASPWSLRDFADDTELPVREMRHMLLHLLKPDDFERISSTDHKRRIVKAFRDENLSPYHDAPSGLDEQLLFIRRKLEEARGPAGDGILDFYEAPFDSWRSKPTKVQASHAWVFQANPKLFDIDRALVDLTEIVWVTRQRKGDIHVGDRVFLWRSGTHAGVVAVGQVASEPKTAVTPDAQRPYWKDTQEFTEAEPRVRVVIDKVVHPPILRTDLLAHPVLRDLTVIRARSGTNFAVTEQQAAELEQLVDAPKELLQGQARALPCFILNQLQIEPGELAGRAEYADREGEVYHWTERSSGLERCEWIHPITVAGK